MLRPCLVALLCLALSIPASGTGCATQTAPAFESTPNIIVVSLDTLRADRLGAWGNENGLTPSLDHFAREAVVFERAWSQSHQTLFSHASLFTGRYCSELGAVDYSFEFPDDVPTLAEVLRIYGYRTGAVVAGGHLDPTFGLTRGFDTYASPVDWGSLSHTAPQALGFIDEGTDDRPFFLFVHGYDTHHRYLKPSPFGFAYADQAYQGPAAEAVRRRSGTTRMVDGWYFPERKFDDLFRNSRLRMRGPEARTAIRRVAEASGATPTDAVDAEQVRAVYDGAVTWADAFFGLFMAALQQRGLLENTVVVVLTDHGEELGETGVFNHRLSLSEQTLHVPLMVRAPGGAGGGRRVHELVGLIDVMPTLLAAAGAPPPASIRGRSLWGFVAGGETPAAPPAMFAEGVYREISARTPDDFVVFSGLAPHSPWIADMLATARLDGPAFASTADPEETARIRELMVAWRAGISRSPAQAETISPERLRILQERGYWTP